MRLGMIQDTSVEKVASNGNQIYASWCRAFKRLHRRQMRQAAKRMIREAIAELDEWAEVDRVLDYWDDLAEWNSWDNFLDGVEEEVTYDY